MLRKRYGDFAHHNKRNPLHELIFIVCSVKTAESAYRKTYRAFRAAFRSTEDLERADVSELASPLMHGGLAVLKARQLRAVFDSIIRRFGRLTLAPLKAMSDSECEAFLTSLPGIGLKVARCIMLYSLDRPVFPVDTHCWRIARRLGWIRATQKNPDRVVEGDMNALQVRIPPRLRFSLHVNMVSLGREFCLASEPRCDDGCPLVHDCPTAGALRGETNSASRKTSRPGSSSA